VPPDDPQHVVAEQRTAEADRVDPNVFDIGVLEDRFQRLRETAVLVSAFKSLLDQQHDEHPGRVQPRAQ